MWDGMAIQPLQSLANYGELVRGVGFQVRLIEDLTRKWAPILSDRLIMYQKLREDARQKGTPMGHDAFHRSYIRFVELVQNGRLGGVRMVAVK